ncbi:MAG: class I SAM-dependent methyltransferase [Rhodanobacteraceae bacterium]
MEGHEARPHDAVNGRVYRAPGVYRRYQARHALAPAEMKVLLRFHRAWVGKDVLDIGVGTGRTTAWLAPFCRRYEAIDYSPVMVGIMRRSRPDIRVHLADMRDMSVFEDASFDMIFAPDNVLDAAAQAGRLQTLGECLRVLRPGGLLIASSHNLEWYQAGRPPRSEWSRNPVRQLKMLRLIARRWRNYLRLRPRCGLRDDHAVYTDIGHDYALLHYYIDQQSQRKQFAAAGFHVRAVLDQSGTELSPDSDSRQSAHLMYVASSSAPA